jgi:hypothetical protein
MQLAGPESPDKQLRLTSFAVCRALCELPASSRAQFTVKQLQGFDIDSSFGSLAQFAEAKWFRTLLDRNNNPEHEFHFDLNSAFVNNRYRSRHQCGKGNCAHLVFFTIFSAKSPAAGVFS